MAVTTPRIAIVGAGPGGLMLASILHHNNIPSMIYERDSSSTVRQQGGSLDVHAYSGQRALHAAGLLDKFRAATRPGGEAIKIMNKDGTVLLDDDGEHEEEAMEGDGEHGEKNGFVKGRPEIDRPALKDILITSLPVETIHWNSKVVSVTQVPNSKQWEIELKNAPRPAPFDLVIGADGAWSRIRSLLSGQEPFYAGIMILDVWADHVDEVAPDVSALVGTGNCFWWGDGRAMLFQRNGQGRESGARCYGCVKTDTLLPISGRALLGLEDTGDEDHVDWSDARMRERFVELNFGDWSPLAKKAFLQLTGSAVLRTLYMLPVGFRWESRPGVTLLGDAAHLMTQFAGVGVNVALMDALELAQGIIGCVNAGKMDGDTLHDMLLRYEEGMFARSREEAAKTKTAMDLQFQRNGAEVMAKFLGSGNPEDFVFD